MKGVAVVPTRELGHVHTLSIIYHIPGAHTRLWRRGRPHPGTDVVPRPEEGIPPGRMRPGGMQSSGGMHSSGPGGMPFSVAWRNAFLLMKELHSTRGLKDKRAGGVTNRRTEASCQCRQVLTTRVLRGDISNTAAPDTATSSLLMYMKPLARASHQGPPGCCTVTHCSDTLRR